MKHLAVSAFFISMLVIACFKFGHGAYLLATLPSSAEVEATVLRESEALRPLLQPDSEGFLGIYQVSAIGGEVALLAERRRHAHELAMSGLLIFTVLGFAFDQWRRVSVAAAG